MSNMKMLNGEVLVEFSDKDYMKKNKDRYYDAIDGNYKELTNQIQNKFKRSFERSDSFLNECFKMVLLQQLTLFRDITNLSKIVGEVAFRVAATKQARDLKVEVEVIEGLVDAFIERQELIKEMKESGVNISTEEINDMNVEFLSFFAQNDLKLDDAGIDHGLREQFKVKYDDIETNVAELFQRGAKESNPFANFLKMGVLAAIKGGLDPSDNIVDMLTEIKAENQKGKDEPSLDLFAEVQEINKEKNQKEEVEKQQNPKPINTPKQRMGR